MNGSLHAAGAALFVLVSTVAVAAAPASAETEIDPQVLELREGAWRAWFAGDESALRRMLPPEFIGVNMSGFERSSLERTIEQSKAFAAGGGNLIELDFPETVAQRYGDVVVFYGRFRAVTESGGGRSVLAGRLTEIFVRVDGNWLHPGWHLDLVSEP